MAASVRHLRPVQDSATDVFTWDYRHVYIGREKLRMDLRRPVRADSHTLEVDVEREEGIRLVRQDVGKSPLPLEHFADITEQFLVCPCRTNDKCARPCPP